MNEIFEPAVDATTKTVSTFGERAKQTLMTQVKEKPAKTLGIILAGSMVGCLLLAYSISRMQAESRRQRLMENWMREAMNWIRENGRKIATPLKEGLEATQAAVEEVSHSSARIGRQAQPFFKRQKRAFLNLF
jgi:hypothetical protein